MVNELWRLVGWLLMLCIALGGCLHFARANASYYKGRLDEFHHLDEQGWFQEWDSEEQGV